MSMPSDLFDAPPSTLPERASRRQPKSAEAFRTISEVAQELEVPQHVLRFWESRFPQVRPLKRAGGRRYYRPDDVVLLRRIRQCLYDQGYTIKGVQKLLREGALRS
ncbi:MAG TPA: MerR family transcriptional regulator, partial [Stellaceae bacterium]|nr:MerR family transcriptional regulator [Stellaceae bacterium]